MEELGKIRALIQKTSAEILDRQLELAGEFQDIRERSTERTTSTSASSDGASAAPDSEAKRGSASVIRAILAFRDRREKAGV